jgi:hypothetical protein
MAYTTINKSTDYFNTLLYTGTGSGGSDRQLTGVGFQPDWTWIKNRDSGQEHVLVDAVRGATKSLDSANTTAEETNNTRVGAFISDGFQLGSGSVQNRVNGNGNGLVAWNWKANGAGSANTDGSINSTVSVNTTSGFSIVKWQGTGSSGTVGHGLGQTPKISFTKSIDNAEDWIVYFTIVDGSMDYMKLNTTDSSLGSGASFTSTTFSKSDSSGENMIAYCFAEKKGFSKFGKYTGNGNADGTFVYTGFKPALIIIKSTGYSENWFIFDNKRPGYNLNANHLNPNDAATETASSANTMDILSNGFKMRATNNGINRSGDTFIYMAIAEEPLVANVGASIPATAR